MSYNYSFDIKYTQNPYVDLLVLYTKTMGMNSVIKNEREALKYETLRSRQTSNKMICLKEGIPIDDSPFASLDEYFEWNAYYRMLYGLPPAYTEAEEKVYMKSHLNDELPSDGIIKELYERYFIPMDQYSYMIPTDMSIFLDLDGRYLHELNEAELNQIESCGIMDVIRQQYTGFNYEYIYHLGNKRIDPYTARVADNFSLLYLPDIPFPEIQYKFKRIFNRNREYTMSVIYSEAYAHGSIHYDNFILILIIIQTMIDMIMEVQEYIINKDVFDSRTIRYLFESYGIDYYKEIPVKYQIRIIKNVNTLLKYKSSNKNIEDILELFDNNDITVFTYYLMKIKNKPKEQFYYYTQEDVNPKYPINKRYYIASNISTNNRYPLLNVKTTEDDKDFIDYLQNNLTIQITAYYIEYELGLPIDQRSNEDEMRKIIDDMSKVIINRISINKIYDKTKGYIGLSNIYKTFMNRLYRDEIRENIRKILKDVVIYKKLIPVAYSNEILEYIFKNIKIYDGWIDVAKAKQQSDVSIGVYLNMEIRTITKDNFTSFEEIMNKYVSKSERNGRYTYEDLNKYARKVLIETKKINGEEAKKFEELYNSLIPIYNNSNIDEVVSEDMVGTEKFNDNYDLCFLKVPITEENASSYIEDYSCRRTYDNITTNDPFWDGISKTDILTDEEKTKHHLAKKSEILDKDFTIERTKYISVDAAIDITKMSYQISYFMNILFDKHIDEELLEVSVDPRLSQNKVKLNDLFSFAIALGYLYNGIEPDMIASDMERNMTINGFNFDTDWNDIYNELQNREFIYNNKKEKLNLGWLVEKQPQDEITPMSGAFLSGRYEPCTCNDKDSSIYGYSIIWNDMLHHKEPDDLLGYKYHEIDITWDTPYEPENNSHANFMNTDILNAMEEDDDLTRINKLKEIYYTNTDLYNHITYMMRTAESKRMYDIYNILYESFMETKLCHEFYNLRDNDGNLVYEDDQENIYKLKIDEVTCKDSNGYTIYTNDNGDIFLLKISSVKIYYQCDKTGIIYDCYVDENNNYIYDDDGNCIPKSTDLFPKTYNEAYFYCADKDIKVEAKYNQQTNQYESSNLHPRLAKDYYEYFLSRDVNLYNKLIDVSKNYSNKDEMQFKIMTLCDYIVLALEKYFDSKEWKYIYNHIPSQNIEFIQRCILKVIIFFKSWKTQILDQTVSYIIDDPLQNYVHILEDLYVFSSYNIPEKVRPRDYIDTVSKCGMNDKVSIFEILKADGVEIPIDWEYKNMYEKVLGDRDYIDTKSILSNNDKIDIGEAVYIKPFYDEGEQITALLVNNKTEIFKTKDDEILYTEDCIDHGD